jgi:hypothetical protein
MRLYVNGREEFPLLCVSTNLLATAAGYRASGIRFLHPLIGLAAGWKGPGRYDWRRIIAYFGRLLAIVPDAVFLPRLHLYAPDWWLDAHPDELIAYALPPDPAGYGMKPRRIDSGFDWNTIADTRGASSASEIWRADQAAALRDFLRAVEASPLRARMAGYHVAGGLNGEWHTTGSHFLPDTSAPMARRTGPPPEAEARTTTTHGLLRDPAAESAVIAFYRRMHECTAEAAAGFCRTVKEETQGRVLAGLFYNYLLENVMIQEAGHLAPRVVLESPHVDFVAAPYSYLHTTRTADRPCGKATSTTRPTTGWDAPAAWAATAACGCSRNRCGGTASCSSPRWTPARTWSPAVRPRAAPETTRSRARCGSCAATWRR